MRSGVCMHMLGPQEKNADSAIDLRSFLQCSAVLKLSWHVCSNHAVHRHCFRSCLERTETCRSPISFIEFQLQVQPPSFGEFACFCSEVLLLEFCWPEAGMHAHSFFEGFSCFMLTWGHGLLYIFPIYINIYHGRVFMLHAYMGPRPLVYFSYLYIFIIIYISWSCMAHVC